MALDRTDPILADLNAVELDGPLGAPTTSELRVLELVALGLSSQRIGERLWISRQAVTYHLGNLFGKFLVDSRTGLVARAFVTGVLEPGAWPPRIADRYRPELRLVRSGRGQGYEPPPRLEEPIVEHDSLGV
jgi:DNA-binding CsgD family transcriptional regulator